MQYPSGGTFDTTQVDASATLLPKTILVHDGGFVHGLVRVRLNGDVLATQAIGTATGFQCALVRTPKASLSACRSSKTYKHLKPDNYTSEVRAFNAAGADPTPATKSFTIT